jgi:O-antigen/teichoic acid export membrane protein
MLSSLTAALAKAISVGATLVSVPLTLHYLGAERYGMWLTMCSFIAMLSFADLGIGNGLLNAVAQASGRDDRRAIRRLVSAGYAALSGIAMSVGLIAASSYSFIPWPKLFNVRSELAVQEVGPAMAVFLACFALGIPLGGTPRIQSALQQGFLSGLWQCGGSLLCVAALLSAIRMEASLPALVAVLCGAPMLINLANAIVYFGSVAPDLRPSFRDVAWSDVFQIARRGTAFFVLQIVIALAYNSDNFVVAQFLGASRVAELAVPAQMFGLITTVLNIALSPLWPAYGEAISRGDHDWVKRTLYNSTLLSVGLAAVAGTLLLFGGPWLLALWVGKGINPPFMLMVGFAVWKVVEIGGNASAMFLNGANVITAQIVLATVTGVTTIGSKIFFVKEFGIVGVPWAMIVSYILFTIAPYCFIVPKHIAGLGPKLKSENGH